MHISIFFFAQRNALYTYVALIIYIKLPKVLNKGGTELQYKTQWQGQIYPWCNSLMSAELTQRWNRLTTCTWNTPVSSEGCSQILQPEGTVRITSSDFLQNQGEKISPISPLHPADGVKDSIPFPLAGELFGTTGKMLCVPWECWASSPHPHSTGRLCSLSSCCIWLRRDWRWRLKASLHPVWDSSPWRVCACAALLQWGEHRLRWEALRADWGVNSPVLGMKG